MDKVALAIERAMGNYMPVPEAGCWLWLGAWTPKGYGVVAGGKKGIKWIASRFFYTHLKGEIPEGMFVCHKCDTPACVNPDHLFLGTLLDNSQDMARKGRGRKAKGVQNSFNKYTPEIVLEVRKLRAEGMSRGDLSRRFGIPGRTIYSFFTNETWRHI